jgi:putative NIF3 family GTP cyclohydrolase 1 type 2
MAVTLRDFIQWLEELIPPALQESYDNSGLQVGDPDAVIESVMLTVDVSMKVIAEAEHSGCGLIISHHPLIFTPLRRIAEGSETESCVAAALRRGIAVYSAHTSFDNVSWGVSNVLARKIGLDNLKVLAPLRGKLLKLVTFVPSVYAEKVRDALFAAGAGHAGNYDRCSFNAHGEGTFRAGEGATPFAGSPGEDHTEPETRIEAVMPSHLTAACVRALLASHPYEEVAYDIITLENDYHGAGAGSVTCQGGS